MTLIPSSTSAHGRERRRAHVSLDRQPEPKTLGSVEGGSEQVESEASNAQKPRLRTKLQNHEGRRGKAFEGGRLVVAGGWLLEGGCWRVVVGGWLVEGGCWWVVLGSYIRLFS